MRVLVLSLLLAPAASWAGYRIDAEGSRTEEYLGRECLVLDRGIAWLDGVSLRDGVVEVDLAMTADRGFHGLVFRAVDDDHYEMVYLRPHESGREDAFQYMPSWGVGAWQIYSGVPYDQAVPVPTERWVHLRLAFQGTRGELSVDGVKVAIPELLRPPVAGRVGLLALTSPARFANPTARADRIPRFEASAAVVRPETPPGAVRRWRVSTTFPEARLAAPALDDRGLEWAPLEAGVRGIADLSVVRKLTEERNTAIAAITLRARRAGPVPLRFGFSDRVVVYLNGRPLYRGNDKYRSRDFRFLGTVGLFDELILPLAAGDNQVWFAVSEDFGGWAVTAQLPPEVKDVEIR